MRKLLLCTALISSASPVWAAITPQELWNKLNDTKIEGSTIAVGSVNTENESVKVNDLVVTTVKEDKNIVLTVPELMMIPQGEGVLTTIPKGVTIKDEDGRTAVISSESLRVLTEGEINDLTTTTTADEISVSMRGVGSNPGSASITFKELDAQGVWSLGEDGLISNQNFNSTIESADFRWDDGSGETAVSASGEVSGVNINGNFVGDHAKVKAFKRNMFDAGAVVDAQTRQAVEEASGSLTVTSEGYAFDLQGPGELKSHYEGGETRGDVNISAGVMSYELVSASSLTQENNPMLGFDATYKTGPFTFGGQFPLVNGGPFSVKSSNKDIVLDDASWTQLDPGNRLPRTAGQFNFDLQGNIRQQSGDVSFIEYATSVMDFKLNDFLIEGAGSTLRVVGEGSSDVDTGYPNKSDFLISLRGEEPILALLSEKPEISQQVGMLRGLIDSYFVPAAPGEGRQLRVQMDESGMKLNDKPLQ